MFNLSFRQGKRQTKIEKLGIVLNPSLSEVTYLVCIKRRRVIIGMIETKTLRTLQSDYTTEDHF